MTETGEYYLGLDGGTDSVGWAVATPDYTVVKKHGKDLWGVRLFESGNTAAERRMNRSARRRTDRKKWRLKLLQEIFDAEITAVDPSFFHRLNESRYWEDDKTVDGADSLFHDVDFSDRDYHRTYNTIYHLRKYLTHCDSKPDIRLVYLSVAHIIKHRGHFLYEGQPLENTRSFSTVWLQLCDCLEEIFEIVLPVNIENKIRDALLNFNGKKSDLSKALCALLGGDGSKENEGCLRLISKLLTGEKVSLAKLFADEELEELKSFSFEEKSLDELDSVYEEKLGEERFFLIRCAYAVYSWALFSRILPEGQTFSSMKVEQYEKHKRELKMLKDIVRKYAPDKYGLVFRAENSKCNYVAYIGKSKSEKRCGKDEFYKFLKKELNKVWENKDADSDVSCLYTKLETECLLPLQVSKENSLIPYQVHLQELEGILTNMRRFYPFIDTPDENGFTPYEKITKLLTFRIPYYVGPLNDLHKDKGFCWIVKRSDERVLPWNFEKVVDEQACEEEFIGRMTSTCTYLTGEDVLPQNSEIYCRFMCLNELNNLKISGNKISVKLKQKIFNELFLSSAGGKITGKKLVDFLNANGIQNSDGEKITKNDISGIDGDFKSSMSPIIKLRNALGNKSVDDETVEKLIFAMTVSGDSNKMIRLRIKKILGEGTDEKVIQKICQLKMVGWGKLSCKLLTEIYHTDAGTGECMNIMDMLWETNDNFMQLLSGKYGFAESIAQFNALQNPQKLSFDYDSLVKNLYVSPAVKRSLWQTLLITREIRKIMGHDPAKIFIEMARGSTAEQKGKRTDSRKDKLLKLYKACKDTERDWVKEIESLPEDKLRSDKLYLYYTQMGRCMYSGEKIELEDLMHDGESKDRLYDIDHIYPQSKVKDDSLNNRVLVKRTLNGEKLDVYPLPSNMRRPELWKLLLSKALISKEKYSRLMRKNQLTDEELAGFINRQLVETRQSTKATAELLKQLFPESEIVYVKAGLVSDFRHEFDFVKCRDTNDFHHAKDAYLNIVVGNVYNEKFTKNPLKFVQSGQEYSIKVGTLFGKLDTCKGERVIWQHGDDGTMQTVKTRMAKNSPMVTRYSYEAHGALFNLQPLKKGNGQLPVKSAPIKNDSELNIIRYGGYTDLKGAYFALVAYENGNKSKKRQKSIEAVPLYRAEEFKKNPDALCAYLQEQIGVEKVEILIPEIKIGTLFRWNGFPMTLSGRSNAQLVFHCAAELRTTPEQEKYLKKIGNYINRCKEQNKFEKDTPKIIPAYDKLTEGENLVIYDYFTELLLNRIYAKRLSAQGKFLRESREKFIALSLEDQVKLLSEALHFFQCNSALTDLSLLGGPSKSGAIYPVKNIKDDVPVSIVHQSVTGFFTKEVCLNNL